MAKENDKKQKKKESAFFKELREKIETETVTLRKIPSILEFVENKTFLGLPYKLFDLQKLILKCFYRGSLGNEELELTKEDVDLINKNNLNHVENGNLIDKWKSGQDFRELVLVWGRRCLSEDVEIVDQTTGKIWSLGEMWNFGKTEIGTWTFDERSAKMLYMTQCNLVYQGKKEVHKVFLSSGHDIEATEDHLLFTEKGWMAVKDLKSKDKVAIASNNSVFGLCEYFTEEQASILGYMSSSCFDSTGDFIASVYNDGVVYDDFKKCAQNINSNLQIDEKFRSKVHSYDNRQYLTIFKESSEDNSVKIVDRLLIENGIKNKTLSQKFVPARIFQCKKNIIISYLRSLFTCGCRVISKKNTTRFTCKIEIQFANNKIAKQIQHLLTRFGVFSQIAQIGEGVNSDFLLTINKNAHVLRFLQQIGIYTYADEIQDIYTNVRAEELSDQPIFSAVEKVVKIGFKRTFDIQVSDFPHLQNFVANGLISHNCIAEDAELIDARTGEKFTFKQAWEQEKTLSSWTYDQDKKSMVIVDDCVVLSQGRRVVYKITSAEGKEIKVTDNHPFLTQRGWVECKDLQDGDRLVFANTSEAAEDKEIYYSDFVSKILIGEKETFDLQVSDNPSLQNFCCNGFVVHNSGKDFLCSIIALYEAMRLLEMPGGDPYKIYNLGSATPFTILTIANSSSQAKILFREIKDKVLQSEYFKDKILPEGVTSDGIHFLTPEDKRRNEELTEKGFSPNLGSIVVRSGHSNSDTLVGISCYVLLLDEIGLYKNTAGASSGDAIFNSLAPAVKTYVREVPKVDEKGKPINDENGQQIIDKIYDGKIICLSTPRGKEGIFYDLYNNHHEVHHRLVCRASTWQVNPMQSKEGLMAAFPSMPEEKFRMEFGAEFSGTAGENFFPEEAVEDCFRDKSLKLREYGKPGTYHFAHLDPATSSHNYALVMAHKETYFDKETGKRDWKIVVDHIKYWSPSPGKPILVDEVDDYVIELNSRFCIGVVTYDHFNSHASIEKLRKKGVPTKMTPFTKRYKNIIFDYLYQLIIQRKLHIPQHLLLRNEMKNLQRKWLNSGYKVYPKRDGDVTTDDIVDALAGACFNCVEKEMQKMPQGKLINLPVQGTNNIVWRSMQGVPYGIGSGGQVARQMENRTPNPRRGV